MCRPSSGCLENLSYYTLRVVPFCGGGRDLALQHESWKLVEIEMNILRGYINCTHLIILMCRLSINYFMFCTTVKLSIDAAPQYKGLNT